jgi:hypothetical protein
VTAYSRGWNRFVDVRLEAVLSDPKTPTRAATTVLVAAVAMVGAAFAPFATQGCGLCRRGPGDTFPAVSLFQGSMAGSSSAPSPFSHRWSSMLTLTSRPTVDRRTVTAALI